MKSDDIGTGQRQPVSEILNNRSPLTPIGTNHMTILKKKSKKKKKNLRTHNMIVGVMVGPGRPTLTTHNSLRGRVMA